MALWAARVQIGTKFENFFPANHSDTLLYRQFQYQYGGAQTLLLMLRVKDGEYARRPQRHECGNRNQRQPDRRAVLKNVLTEPRGLVGARSNHRLGRPRTAHCETPTQRVQIPPSLPWSRPKSPQARIYSVSVTS